MWKRRLLVIVPLAAFAAVAVIACGSASLSSSGDAPTGMTDGGPTTSANDAGGAGDAGADTGPPPLEHCPALLPRTGDVPGTEIERGAFGCYGACGPACTAACTDDEVTIVHPITAGCLSCTYQVKTCKSHAFCRWHDDCYRQCDLRWDAQSSAEPANPPDNPCYLSCDSVVASVTVICGEDWTQLTNPTPSIRDACWDGSFNSFSTLSAEVKSTDVCPATLDRRARPWAPDVGAWDDFANAPTVLPEGHSCSKDTDCPDRNQYCQTDAGALPGLDGTGRCATTVPDAGVDVTQLQPTQTWVPDGGLPDGDACSLGYECASGTCRAGSCSSM